MKLNLDPDNTGGGGGNSDWKASLPEDLRTAKCLESIKDIGALAKSYVNAESLIGMKRLQEPDARWTDKEWDDFYSKTGRPKTAAEYAVPEFKFEEGHAGLSGELVDKAKAHFHKLGLSDRQFKGIMEYYMTSENERFKQQKTTSSGERQAAEDAMKQKFGDKYEAKLLTAKNVLDKFDTEGTFRSFLNESKLGNDPRMVQFLVGFGESLREDKSGGTNNLNFLPDKARARVEIDQLRGDDSFMQKYLSGDTYAKNRWDELHRIAYSDKAA